MATLTGGPRDPLACTPARSPGWVLFLLACVVACASLARPLAVAGQDETDDFAGEYAVTITSGDLPISLGLSAALTGAWRITFDTDGKYTASRQDIGTAVTGSYEVSGEEVTITDEAGLVSCSNIQPSGEPAPVATYAWEKTGNILRLTPVDETCRLRQALLSTNPLSPYVACLTTPLDLDGDEGGADEPAGPATGANADLDESLGDSTEEASPDASPEASPHASPDAASPEAEPTETPDPTPTPTPAEIGTADDPEEAIAEVLAQLTACWATGDPARVLALFSEGFLDEATGGGAVSLDELANDIRQQQTTLITWELAGEVDVDDDEATAVVAVTFAEEELLQTFIFELGDDGWRLGNFGE